MHNKNHSLFFPLSNCSPPISSFLGCFTSLLHSHKHDIVYCAPLKEKVLFGEESCFSTRGGSRRVLEQPGLNVIGSHVSPTYSLSWTKLCPFTAITLSLSVLSLLTIMSDPALLFRFCCCCCCAFFKKNQIWF